jgi:hypothetical protein
MDPNRDLSKPSRIDVGLSTKSPRADWCEDAVPWNPRGGPGLSVPGSALRRLVRHSREVERRTPALFRCLSCVSHARLLAASYEVWG